MIDFNKHINNDVRNIEIYCDGAIKGVRSKGTKYGGIGIIPVQEDLFDYLSIPYIGEDLTNNRLEMLAVIFTILFSLEVSQDYKGKTNINIKSDSEYTVDGYNINLDNWIIQGWKNSSGADVKNKELWKLIERVKCYLNRNRNKYYVNLQWTKGHDKEKYNELSDEYAVKAKMEAYENNESAFTMTYAIEKAESFINKLEEREKMS
ncbi:ribonuclease HI [Staphylococcus phage vB_StaM_SA1]|nr:ribonuclease HI [Staphylococcus phage vB_StaM_SA1]